MFSFCYSEDDLSAKYWMELTAEDDGVNPFPAVCWQSGRGYFSQVVHDFSLYGFKEQSRASTVDQCQFFDGNISLVAWVRMDNRQELLGKLGLSVEEFRCISDEHLLCLCWQKWQEACVDHLLGDFSFVLYDKRADVVFGARDHFGVRPLYYAAAENTFCCAASMRPLLELKRFGMQLRINQQWFCDYLCDHGMSFTETPVEKICKLPPGHCFLYKNNTLTLHQYYTLSLQQKCVVKQESEYVELFRHQLQEAVRCRLSGVRETGCELSGGLDSGGISGVMAHELGFGHQFHVFGFSQFKKDVQHMRAQCEFLEKRAACPLLHLFEWDLLNDKIGMHGDMAGSILGHPVEHESSSFVIPLYEHAQGIGVGSLLSGFGGDEFVTNIQHHLVIRYIIRQGHFADLVKCFEGNLLKRSKSSGVAVLRYLKQVVFGKRGGFNATLLNSFTRYWQFFLVQEHLKKRYSIRRRYFERTDFDRGYTDLHRFLVEKRMQPFIPARMANCSLAAARFGVEYRWPLLDKRLVELYLSLPQELSYRAGRDRNVYREAVKPYVHPLIYNNPGKKMGNPVIGQERFYIREKAIEYKHLHPVLQEIVDEQKYCDQLVKLERENEDEQSKYFYARNVSKLLRLQRFLDGCDFV